MPLTDDNEYRVRRVNRNDNVGNKMASWRYHGNTALTKLEMNRIIEERGCRVASQGRKKDERYDNEIEVVVGLQLHDTLAPAFLADVVKVFVRMGSKPAISQLLLKC